MSVINQMLKDLDKRQGEQNVDTNTVLPAATKSSNMKWLLSVVLVIVIINLAGVFAWQLYSENQQLKEQAQQSAAKTNRTESNITNNGLVSTEQDKNAEKKAGAIIVDAIESSFAVESVADELQSNFDKNQQAIDKELATSSVAAHEQPLNEEAIQILENRRLDDATVTPDNLPTRKGLQKGEVVIANKATVAAEQVIEKSKPRLSISRSQLSPQALAKKKITQAEQAMEVNNLSKAESLFEEVLLLLPEHEVARKQLAALWYGKKEYQNAINLLSQGIALAPQAEEMRLMSARIYFEQGQAQAALNLLVPASNSNSVELQALLASVAAEVNEHNQASSAYQKLLAIEPHVGRWWLGLAVSLDSQGQFSQASNAYRQAMATGNLSSNTMQFARQRLVELGE